MPIFSRGSALRGGAQLEIGVGVTRVASSAADVDPRVGLAVRGVDPVLELVGEQQVREFAPTVRLPLAVRLLPVEV